MKNVLYRGSLCVMAYVAIIFIIPNKTIARPYYGVSFQLFYDELAPYGSWMYDREFGYVWSPYVGDDFWPYATNGNWVVTEYGNTWVSDYSWGWAPFHYGRWRYHDYYGWQWIPGTEWSPAWVAWRSGGGYYGWAPLGPGVSININIGNYIPQHCWVFVPQIHICSPRVYSYCAPRPRVVNIIHQTTIINNTYVYNRSTYYCGPNRRDIERTTNRRVEVRRFNNMERPGTTVVRDGAVSVYRPAIEAGGRDRVRPSRVVSEHSFHSDRREGIGRAYQPADNNRNSTPSNSYGESNRGNADRDRGGRTEGPYTRPNGSNDDNRQRTGNGRENSVYQREEAPVNSNGGRRQNETNERQRIEQPRQSEEAPTQPQQRVEQPRERERQNQPQVEQPRPQREYQSPRQEAPSQPQRVEQSRPQERQYQPPAEQSRPQREYQPQRQETPSQPQRVEQPRQQERQYQAPAEEARPQREQRQEAPAQQQRGEGRSESSGERGSGRGR